MASAVPADSTLTQNEQTSDFIGDDAVRPEKRKAALRGNPDPFAGRFTKAPRLCTKTKRLTNGLISRAKINLLETLFNDSSVVPSAKRR